MLFPKYCKHLGIVVALSCSGLVPTTHQGVRVIGREMVVSPVSNIKNLSSNLVVHYGISGTMIISHEGDEISAISFEESLAECTFRGDDCQTNARAPKQSRTRNKGPPY